MKHILILIISFIFSIQFAFAASITLVSNTTQWLQSSTVLVDNNVPWSGVSSLPNASTYTITPTAGGTHVDGISGATNLFSANGIRFYQASFNLTSFSSIIADIRVAVDNDVHIFINGKFVALEGSLTGDNFSDGNPHRLLIGSSGAITNGYLGGQSFDSTAGTFSSSNWVIGTNTIVLAVRNLSPTDSGGLSFRMDISTVDMVVPEPNSLCCIALFLFAWLIKKRK